MNAILKALAADQNLSPAFAKAVRPEGFGQFDNWVISNTLGQACSVAHADSAENALRGFPAGYTARVQRYRDPEDCALARRVSAAFGRLD